MSHEASNILENTMKYTLKAYYTKKNYDLPDDYCQICTPDGYSVDPYYVFVDEDGNEHEIGAFDWKGSHGYNNVDLHDKYGTLEKFENPMIRNDDSDVIVVKDSPGNVVFELNENGDFPRITIE